MTSRLMDFLFVVLFLVIACSGTSLMIYAVWHIGRRICMAIHTLLTCWEFGKGPDDKRRRLLGDPVMYEILTMRLAFSRVFAPLSRYATDLQRLRAYRYEQARHQASQMVWDSRLGALLTRDEYDFVYGAGGLPSAGAPAPFKPIQPSHSSHCTVAPV